MNNSIPILHDIANGMDYIVQTKIIGLGQLDLPVMLRVIPLQPVDTLSPTGSALARTDLSPLTNGIWEVHAGSSCFLHLQLLALILRHVKGK